MVDADVQEGSELETVIERLFRRCRVPARAQCAARMLFVPDRSGVDQQRHGEFDPA